MSEQEVSVQSGFIVKGQIIPIGEDFAIVPNSIVSEIVEYSNISKDPGKENWDMGCIQWSGIEIPIAYLPGFFKGNTGPDMSKQRHVAVMKGPLGRGFFGLLMSGVPRLIDADETRLTHNSMRNFMTKFTQQNVYIKYGEDTISGYIPNLRFIEGVLYPE